MWSERIIKMCFFSGVAPVYKPGNLATGQYPQMDAGYLASDRATVFCEYSVIPDYERYTNDQQSRYDMLYELKVDANGRTVSPLVRTAKWTIFSARLGESLFPLPFAATTIRCRIWPCDLVPDHTGSGISLIRPLV
jgi:hypothetical protein